MGGATFRGFGCVEGAGAGGAGAEGVESLLIDGWGGEWADRGTEGVIGLGGTGAGIGNCLGESGGETGWGGG